MGKQYPIFISAVNTKKYRVMAWSFKYLCNSSRHNMPLQPFGLEARYDI